MGPLARAELKRRLDIKYGASSKAIEAAVRESAWAILRRSTKEQKTALPDLPVWCTAAALEAICWKVLVLLGRVADATGPGPPMPEEVPSVHERPDRAVRGRAAKAWDLFMRLNDTEIELRASQCRHQVRFVGKSKRVQLRMVAGDLWKKFHKSHNEAYAAHT